MKFLIDECLSVTPVEVAISRGFVESAHIAWRGRAGSTDWSLMSMIIDEDWTFVTGNSRDFRGRRRDGGLFSKEMIHAGLVCLNAGASGTFSLNIQRELFEVALDEFKRGSDLVNQVLELTTTHDGDIEVLRYDLP